MVSQIDLNTSLLSRGKYTAIFGQTITATGEPSTEIIEILTILAPHSTQRFLTQIHNDVAEIFHERNEVFLNNCPRYHDFEHTMDVILAVARFLHGLYLKGITLPQDIIELCLLTGYFHDIGILLTKEEMQKKDATCLKHHEQRSIHFLHNYMGKKAYLLQHKNDCAAIINCTDLSIDPASLRFSSPETQLIGYILGSADLLAQMASRYYLESLELLYQEQCERGLATHRSLLEMLRQTTRFYNKVVIPRLDKSFNNICNVVRNHFEHWWDIDSNLYLELTTRNIAYLEYVIQTHDEGKKGLQKLLRRKRPSSNIPGTQTTSCTRKRSTAMKD